MVIEALELAAGNIKLAARLLHIDEATIYRYSKRDDQVARAIGSIRMGGSIGVRAADRMLADWLERVIEDPAIRAELARRALAGDWRSR